MTNGTPTLLSQAFLLRIALPNWPFSSIRVFLSFALLCFDCGFARVCLFQIVILYFAIIQTAIWDKNHIFSGKCFVFKANIYNEPHTKSYSKYLLAQTFLCDFISNWYSLPFSHIALAPPGTNNLVLISEHLSIK